MATEDFKRILFIDTSIFEANNFFEGDRIKQILKLASEGTVKILMPIITYYEILNRAGKNIEDATLKIKKLKNESRVIRNLDSVKGILDSIDLTHAMEEFKSLLDNKIKSSKIELLDYPTINIKEVFDSYFNDKFPFSKGAKKNEFPDAFAIITIEKWCEDNGVPCHIISHDKDLINYKSKYISNTSTLELYLDKILKELKTSKLIEGSASYYIDNENKLASEINLWVRNQLDDDSFYYSHFEMDVHYFEIISCETDIPNHFQFVSIENDEIIIEARASIRYEVEVEIDDENTYWYDSEDKVGNYYDTVHKIVSEEAIIYFKSRLVIEHEIPIAIEIIEINNNKKLSIPSEFDRFK
jgi:hypothetical protein